MSEKKDFNSHLCAEGQKNAGDSGMVSIPASPGHQEEKRVSIINAVRHFGEAGFTGREFLTDKEHFPEFRHGPKFIIHESFQSINVFAQLIHFCFGLFAKPSGFPGLVMDG